MLQTIATLASLAIAAGMLALIAAILMDDWRMVTRALGLRRPLPSVSLPIRPRITAEQYAQVIRISWQPTPQRAAA